MSVIHLDDTNFDAEIKEGTVLVDFYAEWCGPCKMLAPFIDKIASEIKDVKIVKIDVDKAPKTAQAFNVMTIPTLIAFKDGQPVDQKVGFIPENQIVDLINSAR